MTTWLNFIIVLANQEAQECENRRAGMRKEKESLADKNLPEKSEMKELFLTSIVLITRNVKRHPMDKTAFELSIATLEEKMLFSTNFFFFLQKSNVSLSYNQF